MIQAYAFDVAQRFIGVQEVEGSVDNPMVLAMLKLDNDWPENDEVPWCSGFVNYVCWICRLPRSKSLLARSWLGVGRDIPLDEAEVGDIVVLQRGGGNQPGPEDMTAPGHVGFYSGYNDGFIELLGGNQSDEVKTSLYDEDRLLSIRRLT